MNTQHAIVIFGCGGFGLAVAKSLRQQGLDFLLVGSDRESVAAAGARGFEALELDYTDDDVLRSVGVGVGVRIIFCLFDEATNNLFLTLSARALAPTVTIISVCESHESGNKLRAAGADKTIDPYVLTGRWIHDLIRRPVIIEIVQQTLMGEADLEIAEITVTARSALVGQCLEGLDLSRYNLLVMGVVDCDKGTDLIFRTSQADHCFSEGDVLVVIGPDNEIREFRRDMSDQAPDGDRSFDGNP